MWLVSPFLVVELNWHRVPLSEVKEHLKEQSVSFSTWSRRCSEFHTEHFASYSALIRSSPRSMSQNKVRHSSSITSSCFPARPGWILTPGSTSSRDWRSAFNCSAQGWAFGERLPLSSSGPSTSALNLPKKMHMRASLPSRSRRMLCQQRRRQILTSI